uniref:SET and MYND domain-containing protein DDB_G0284059-like n=1 Tax=Dermatophagoides pteronyssinus TaxID=6956 RepID=A0A6P6XZ99_DERPT
FEKESIRQALINIDYALRFYLSKQYLLTKIYLLMKLGNENRAEKLLKILIENYQIKSDDEFRKFLQTKYDNRSPICKPEYLSRMFIDEDSNDSNEQQTSYLDPRLLLINRSGQGRFFIANEPIDKDELILREQPYTLAMFTESSLKRCQNCYRQVTNIFFPCINCNEIIYCSINCLEQSYDLYHRFECRMNQYWIDCSKSTYHMFKLLNRLGIDNVLKLTSFDQQQEQEEEQQQQGEQQQQQEQQQESSSISLIEAYINDQKSTENDVKSKQNDND